MIRVSVSALAGINLFQLYLWPILLFVEAVVYWLIRKKIKQRRWAWWHLIFSLFAFVLLKILYALIAFIIISYFTDIWQTAFGILQNIQFYSFWSLLIIGHAFFIVAIVRSFYDSRTTDENDDLLSEFFA